MDGYRFYEMQVEGLGQYFLNTLYTDIEKLRFNAGFHPLYFGKYYRHLSKRFPFAIYYRVKNDTVFIYAVLDCRRSPAWIRRKLS